jgi:hypothetical protein
MRLSSSQILPILLGLGLAAAGWLQGWKWRQEATGPLEGDRVEMVALQQQIDQLTQENQALRSMAQGGGEFAVPAELVARVEKHLGLSFLSTPVVHRIAGEELLDRVKASIEARCGDGGLEDRQTAYQLIGFLGENDRLIGQLAALRTVGARAWFDEVSGEGWVTDRFQDAHIPDQAALLRVLTRILLDQHFPWRGGYLDDAIRSRDALHAGVAAGVESKFFQDNARAIGFMTAKEDHEAGQLLLSLPPFVQGLSSFQGIEGKTLADQLRKEGRDVLLERLRRPPQRSSEVMFLFERPVPDRRVSLPKTPGESVLEESAGALGLRLWLEGLGDPVMARAMAEAWVDDRWLMFATDDRTQHLIWQVDFAKESIATKALPAFAAMAAAVVGLEQDVTVAKETQGADGTWVKVARVGPTTLQFIRAQSRDVLTAIGSGKLPTKPKP